LQEYIKLNQIDIVMVSEVSRLGMKVVNILQTVDELHCQGVSVYVQQFNMLSLEGGKENPLVMLLLQMLSIGAQVEYSQRAERQKQGIQIAKLKGKYRGRKKHATASKEKILIKYKNVAELIKKSELSLRRIAEITNHSINTVRKVNVFTS
jgi:DNA invertase Pin-like site-specific DNA recombinase